MSVKVTVRPNQSSALAKVRNTAEGVKDTVTDEAVDTVKDKATDLVNEAKDVTEEVIESDTVQEGIEAGKDAVGADD